MKRQIVMIAKKSITAKTEELLEQATLSTLPM